MADINPYTLPREDAEKALRAAEDEAERLRGVVEWLRAQEAKEDGGGTETDLPPGESEARQAPRRPRMAKRKAKPRTKLRGTPFGEPVNPGGESWTDAITAVLQDGEAHTVAEIVEELTTRGRQFGKSRPDMLVRQALRRGEKRGLWTQKGRPARWKIAK